MLTLQPNSTLGATRKKVNAGCSLKNTHFLKRFGFCILRDLNGLFNFLHYLFKVRSILFVTMQLFVSQENMSTVDEFKIFFTP